MRRAPGKDEIIALLPEMAFFITERSGVVDADMIAAGKNLRLIQRLGIQTWDIDLEAARRAGIPVCCLPVATCQLVAEHVMLQALGLIKRVRELMKVSEDGGDWGQAPRRCDEDYFAYNWSRRQSIEGLMGKTVGILGFGEIGVELAQRLKAFDCPVLYQKRKRLPPEVEAQFNLRYASREEVASASDIVVGLMPFGPETEQGLDASFFAAMKPGAFFIQTGGSGTVDEVALAGGAALRPPGRGGRRRLHLGAGAAGQPADRAGPRSHVQSHPDAACRRGRDHHYRRAARRRLCQHRGDPDGRGAAPSAGLNRRGGRLRRAAPGLRCIPHTLHRARGCFP